MKTKLLFSILALVFAQTVSAEMGTPEDIPNAGRIRIDGNLRREWNNAEWAPLDHSLDGQATNISNAFWSLQWDDEPSLYIAVRYDDTDLVLQDGFIGSNAQDCVEIYVRGDNGSEPLDYSKTQVSAQHYIFGLAKDKTTAWKKLTAAETFPAHNPAKVAVVLNGNSLIYEMMVPIYDEFDIQTRRNCETTEAIETLEIGVDITLVDVGSTGYAGRKSENTRPGKNNNADAIALHTLSE